MRKLVFAIVIVTSIIFAVKSRAQPGYITTVAGTGTTGFSGDGGPATAATMADVEELCTDAGDNVYFADYPNNRIRKITTLGIISTIAGGGSILTDGVPATSAALSLSSKTAITVDKAGNVYFVEDNRIRKISFSTGILTTIAGSTTPGYTGDGGPATAALFFSPSDLCVDVSGNMYIAEDIVNRVRKINTSGIVNTIAGLPSPGFSGDGGPATAAMLNVPVSLCTDTSGNVYVADMYNHRIRKINPTGIISTYAGSSGSGFSGDGGPATTATLSSPNNVCIDRQGNLFVTDMGNLRIRKIDASGIVATAAGGGLSYSDNIPATTASLSTPKPIAIDGSGNLYTADLGFHRIRKITSMTLIGMSDSFAVAANRLCNGPEMKVHTASYTEWMSIETNFGDGTTDTTSVVKSAISGGFAGICHTYKATGIYNITQVLYYGSTPIDTITSSYNYTFCRTLPVKLYAEGNGNCTLDAGESYMSPPSVAQVDSNGINVGTIPATGGFNYNAYAPPGTVYSFKLISRPGNLIVACPSTGIITDTILSSISAYPDKYFGLACPSGSTFDFGIKAVPTTARVNSQCGHIFASNKDCYAPGATVTMHFSPKWVFDASQAVPKATTVTGNTATWNTGPLYGTDPAPFNIYYKLLCNPATGDLKVQDTVHAAFIITPTTGDSNPTDNTVITIDTVHASYDPNAIYVSPNGCVPKGTTNLEYTITFENTGNDTAHNIYVMDTLSDKLDVQSLRIVMASANMNFGILKDGPYTIAKFDFPNIKLLDSSHHGLCDGTVIYTIDMQKGLANDTRIYNRAGIYFDVNEVVLTNTSENIIGCPPLAIDNLPEIADVNLYPNPTTDELTITTEKQYNSFTITNSIGQVMMEQTMTNAQTKVSVKALPAGLYYISLRGSEGVMVQKFVKL